MFNFRNGRFKTLIKTCLLKVVLLNKLIVPFFSYKIHFRVNKFFLEAKKGKTVRFDKLHNGNFIYFLLKYSCFTYYPPPSLYYKVIRKLLIIIIKQKLKT